MTGLTALVRASARPEAAAVARAALGVAAALKALERAPVLDRLRDPETLRVPYLDGQPTLTDLPPELVIGTWIVLAVAFAVGLGTRLSGAGLTILLAAVLFSDQQLYSNHLYLLVWLVGLLTLAGPDATYSVDALRGSARGTAAWPLALVRIQVSVLYLFAGLSKINAVYLSGTVVSLSLRDDGFLAIPIAWRTFETMAAASLLAVLAELGLAIGLWLPKWRRTAFVVGLGLHAGIALWFEPTVPLLVFALISLAPYVLFLDLAPRPITLVFDDSCGFCTTWVRWLRRLDWLRFLHVVPGSDADELARLAVPREDADRALQLLDGDGRSQGFDAVVGVLEHLPIAFLWAPLLRLWPIRAVGRVAYRRTAARRSCTIDPSVRRAAD